MVNRSHSGKLVSVVLPTFNRAYCLERAIRSVLSQTYANLELLVIDDGSTDSTEEICTQIARRDRRLRYLQQANGGVAAARNLGLEHAIGEYVAFLDSDDWWRPFKLELQLEVMQSFDDVGLCWTDMTSVDVDSNELEHSYLTSFFKKAYTRAPFSELFPRSTDIELDIDDQAPGARFHRVSVFYGDMFEAMLWGNLVHTSTALFRRSLLKNVRGFRVDLRRTGEDFDFYLRLSQHTKLALISAPTSYYRVGGDDQLMRPGLGMFMALNYIKTLRVVLEDAKVRERIGEQTANRMLAKAYLAMSYKALRRGKYDLWGRFLQRSQYLDPQIGKLHLLAAASVPSSITRFIHQSYRSIRGVSSRGARAAELGGREERAGVSPDSPLH